jgi:anti-sigma B factor antagonist
MSTCACVPQPEFLPATMKEPTLKLNFKIYEDGDATVLYCAGRIVYREEAAALSRKVMGVLSHTRQLVVDLSAVEMIDSAGLGELVAVLKLARASQSRVKLAAPSRRVHALLTLTNLSSLFEIHRTTEDALDSLRQSPLVQAAIC